MFMASPLRRLRRHLSHGERIFETQSLSLTRLAAEGMERAAERPDDVRKKLDKYRFDEAVRSA